nr:immunoglobulin light chain junction region [Macaca mulatta]
CQQETSWSHSF